MKREPEPTNTVEAQHAECVVGWTWNVHFDSFAYAAGGDGLKVFRTKEEAEADARRTWYDDVEITLLRCVLIDGEV